MFLLNSSQKVRFNLSSVLLVSLSCCPVHLRLNISYQKIFKCNTISGTRCSNDQDCGEGKCCARQHGEYICKNKLQHGHMCFVPKGGLAYSLNELCPCEEGLVCINIAQHRK